MLEARGGCSRHSAGAQWPPLARREAGAGVGSSKRSAKRRGIQPDLFRPSSYRLPTVAEYRPHPTDRPRAEYVWSETVGRRRSTVGVRREPPSARVFRPPRLPTVIRPGRMWSDDVSCRRRRPETRTYSETPSKIDRSQILVPPPTVIRPFTTVFSSSSDRHPTGIEHGRMTSRTPGRQCPPSLFRPYSAPLPTVFHPRTVG